MSRDSRRFHQRAATHLLAMALFGAAQPLQASAPASGCTEPHEHFYPDTQQMAMLVDDGEREVRFRVRPGQEYEVVEHDRRDRMLRIEAHGDPSRTGWVRFVPAELIPPGIDVDGDGPHPFSEGWDRLYDRASASEDESELRRRLRAMNKNFWSLGYKRARDVMYSSIDAKDGKLRCVYTGMQFPAGRRPGPGPGGELMNAEHSFPQSKFQKREPMRSDLHHLFPTESQANSVRGHKDFVELPDNAGEAVGDLGAQVTESSFEPPPGHKGNVARAMFYFAVQHRMRLGNRMEASLRRWHVEDPVDDAERARNEAIYGVQRSRNFFIDRPDLVERIADF